MEADICTGIEALHASGWGCVLAATGGGAGLPAWLLAVPGASRSVLEVVVPYHEEALCQFLGRRPASFCSAATSRDMARRALERAGWLLPGGRVFGTACTASLRSDRPKRGEHRAHLALCRSGCTVTWSLTLTKEARSRQEEEDLVDRFWLIVLLEELGISTPAPLTLLPGETIEKETTAAAGTLATFLDGKGSPALRVEADGQITTERERPLALLPGSFNPLHQGHWEMARATAAMTGVPVAFELTVVNADKPPLEEAEVRCRLLPFAWRATVWLTRAPTFAEKAQLFPGAVFIVGADTAARIVQPRFYGASEPAMRAALAAFRDKGCRFLVAGRVDASGRFLTLDDLALASEVRDLFQAIPGEGFRCDVSSTDLRSWSANVADAHARS